MLGYGEPPDTTTGVPETARVGWRGRAGGKRAGGEIPRPAMRLELLVLRLLGTQALLGASEELRTE